MLKDIKIPCDVSSDGAAIYVEGSNVVDQNIIIAVTPAGSLHPWNQNLTPDEDMIFEIKDLKAGGQYSVHVREFFVEMERQGYARLLEGENGIKILEAEDGNLVIMIRYINLESGRIENVKFDRRVGGG